MLYKSRKRRKQKQQQQGGYQLTPEEFAETIGDTTEQGSGTLGTIVDGLDFLGNRVRSTLVGEPLQFDRTVSGRDVLRHYGLADDEDDYYDFFGGLAVEIATDPLSYITGPTSSLTKAGKVAKGLGVVDDAARAASRKAMAGKGSKKLAQYAKKGADKFSDDMGRAVTDLDLYARPTVGKRAALRETTLQDMIDFADEPLKDGGGYRAGGKSAGEVMRERMVQQAGGEAEFNRIKDMQLGNTLGLGLPFGDAQITGNLGGIADSLGDTLDTVGGSLRHSGIGRGVAKVFDKRVRGAGDAETQALRIAGAKRKEQVQRAVTGFTEEKKAKLFLGAEDAFSAETNKAMGRLIEGNATHADKQLEQSNKAVKEYLDFWRESRGYVPMESEKFGLSGAELDHTYDLGYMPYELDPALQQFMDLPQQQGARVLRTTDGSQMQRSAATQIAGGRDQLMELSQDARFVGKERTIENQRDVWDALANEAHGAPSFDALDKEKKQAVKSLEALLYNLPADYMQTNPLFGQHPVHLVGRYFQKRYGAMADADTILEDLTNRALQTTPEGAHSQTVAAALKDVGLKGEGVRQKLRERIATKLGGNADDIDLHSLSIAKEDVVRLKSTADVFSNPLTSSKATGVLDKITELWKRSILAFPSRWTRDLISGAFSNWLVGVNTIEGYSAAAKLMTAGPRDPEFLAYIGKLPRYQGLQGDELVAKFYGDLGESGLLKGRQAIERSTAVGDNEALASMIGTTASGDAPGKGFFDPLVDSENYKNFFQVRTRRNPIAKDMNPVLKQADKLNDFSDGINRVSGYLSALESGYDPIGAGKVVTRAQVDYDSLSEFERNVLRDKLFPWYSFTSRSFKELVRQLAERPGGRYGQVLRGMDYSVRERPDDVMHIPEYMQRKFAIPLGKDEQGRDKFLYNIDLLQDTLAKPQIRFTESGLPDPISSVFETTKTLGQDLNPFYRVGAEFATGRDFRTGDPLTQSDSGIASRISDSVGAGTGIGTAVADRVLDLVPGVSRIQRPIGNFLRDDDRSVGDKATQELINTFTGVKFGKQTEEQLLNVLRREGLDNISNYTDSYSIPYISKDDLPNAPPSVQREYAVISALQKRLSEIRKAKKDAR